MPTKKKKIAMSVAMAAAVLVVDATIEAADTCEQVVIR
jgi:hypothetical protein